MSIAKLAQVVLWMTGALLSFSTMAVSVRLLSYKLNTFDILFVRCGVGLLIVLSLLAVVPSLRPMVQTGRIGFHVVRNGVHFASQCMWALALTLLPFATVFALEFTMPIWTLLLAVLFLGERATQSRIGAVVLGLVGVLIILRPGVGTFNPAALLVLGAAFGYAITMVTTKKLVETDTTFAVLFWMTTIQLPLAMTGIGPSALARLEMSDLPAMIAIGAAGLTSHLCLTNAFRVGDATLVVPLDFLRIPLIATIGWVFFGENLDIFVLLGALVIVVGILWSLRAEAARKS